MEPYIARKAGEALEAMCGKQSLTKRLENARDCFAKASNEHFLSTAPQDVRESITAFMRSKGGRGCPKAVALVQDVIYFTLVEYGREHAGASQTAKRK